MACRMIPFFITVFAVHKIWRRTQWRRLDEIDLAGETAEFEAYEAELLAAAEALSGDVIVAEEDDEKTATAIAQSRAETQTPKQQARSRFAGVKKRFGRQLDRAGFLLY